LNKDSLMTGKAKTLISAIMIWLSQLEQWQLDHAQRAKDRTSLYQKTHTCTPADTVITIAQQQRCDERWRWRTPHHRGGCSS
jgi:cytochrome oxidase assembly protein ShyY1